MTNILDALTRQLKLWNCTNIQPVMVRIGRAIYSGARYSQNDERRVYVLGELPASHRLGKFVYAANEGEYYLTGYITESGIKPEFNAAHPFGANFLLSGWHSKYETRKHPRKPMTVSEVETFSIISGDGMAECDFTTGMIVSDETDYRMSRVDVAEYQAWLSKNGLPPLEAGQSVDCLFIGWKTLDGERCPAEHQARRDYLKERAENNY